MDREESFFAVKPPSSGMPSVGSDDEDSFVVLGTSDEVGDEVLNDEILPPIRSAKIHEMQSLIKMEISQINNVDPIPEMPSVDKKLSEVTSKVPNIALSPDSSYEEVQRQVEELIKENEKLKNTIAQNNLSMKTQYDRILAWKDEVTGVMKNYKDKLLEAKTFIDKCKEENTKLANDVEKYKEIKELQDQELLAFKRKEKERENASTVQNTSQQNMVQFDLEVASKKNEELKTELEERKQQYNELSEEHGKLLKKFINSKSEEVQARDAEIATLKSNLDALKSELDLAKVKIQELSSETAQNTAVSFEEQLEAKDKQINELQQECDSQITLGQTLTHDNIKLKNEVAELLTKLENQMKKNLQISESANQNSVYQSKIQLGEAKISQLEQELQEQKTIQTAQAEELTIVRTQLKKMKQNYDSLLEKYENSRQQLMNSQMTITGQEEEIKNKVGEIEQLRILLQSSSNTDEIYALKEQLAVYKNDFEAEREARANLKGEKDQMAEDMQNLQRRNKQMQNELEALRGGPKTEKFICPRCSFSFNSYQSLENHVHRCLDLEEQFP